MPIYGTNSPKYKGYFEYSMLHAESLAYKRAKALLNNKETFEIINIRLNNSGEPRLSKPCICCYNFLRALNCSKAWFTTETGFASMNMSEGF
jgi:hypothetical protein